MPNGSAQFLPYELVESGVVVGAALGMYIEVGVIDIAAHFAEGNLFIFGQHSHEVFVVLDQFALLLD